MYCWEIVEVSDNPITMERAEFEAIRPQFETSINMRTAVLII